LKEIEFDERQMKDDDRENMNERIRMKWEMKEYERIWKNEVTNKNEY
jgi:hypothetical protein